MIVTIPNDMYNIILNLLNIKDLISLSLTCKKLLSFPVNDKI